MDQSLRSQVLLLFFFLLFMLAVWIVSCRLMIPAPPQLQIIACDIGQGDAILLKYGSLVILIDTGPDSAILRCLQRNISFPKRNIDILILTHADKDHIGGVKSVYQNFTVDKVLWNGVKKETVLSEEISQFLLSQKESLVVEGGESIVVPGLRVRVVWSEKMREARLSQIGSRGKSEDEINGGSVGVFVEGLGFGFLSLGDLECPQELAVTTMPLLRSVTVLKASHHGSKTSSCKKFVEKIAPETIIIPVGKKNTYGHPDRKILADLEKLGIFVLRTDLLGEIHILPGKMNYRQN